MKKFALIASALLLPLSVMATTDASADNKPVAAPAVAVSPNVIRFLATTVHGNITVPAAPTGALAGFNCSNITIYASSVAQNPAPAGGIFTSSKWTRHAQATGNYAGGTCQYSMNVPGGSAFSLNAGGAGSFHCDVVSTWVGPTGAAIGPYTVPFGSSKDVNIPISQVVCENIH